MPSAWGSCQEEVHSAWETDVNPVSNPPAGRAQVEPPDAYALGAGELDRLVEGVIEAPRPMAEGLGVVVLQAPELHRF